VMLVTPLRDGMNLVAKEYVASRTDRDGVLVLSEFAGAADELPEAVSVNPYAIDDMADAFARALSMGAVERRQRMDALRRSVSARDVRWWSSAFLRDLDAASPIARDRFPVLVPNDAVEAHTWAS
jgi:trehalose-6-phosphate synthase